MTIFNGDALRCIAVNCLFSKKVPQTSAYNPSVLILIYSIGVCGVIACEAFTNDMREDS